MRFWPLVRIHAPDIESAWMQGTEINVHVFFPACAGLFGVTVTHCALEPRDTLLEANACGCEDDPLVRSSVTPLGLDRTDARSHAKQFVRSRPIDSMNHSMAGIFGHPGMRNGRVRFACDIKNKPSTNFPCFGTPQLGPTTTHIGHAVRLFPLKKIQIHPVSMEVCLMPLLGINGS